MEVKLICENKYGYKNKTISLPILIENLPSEIIFEKETFLLKSSHHVSLICIGEAIKKHNIIISDFEDKIINDFCEFVKTNEIKFSKYLNDYKFATRDDLKSIIVMCQVINLDKFFNLINEKYELNIEYPPTHVTLYTPLHKSGIFLSDSSDIQKLTKSISNPLGFSL